MTRSAPSLVTSALPAGLAVVATKAPITRASWMANVPMPPAPAWTRILSPACKRMSSLNAW